MLSRSTTLPQYCLEYFCIEPLSDLLGDGLFRTKVRRRAGVSVMNTWMARLASGDWMSGSSVDVSGREEITSSHFFNNHLVLLVSLTGSVSVLLVVASCMAVLSLLVVIERNIIYPGFVYYLCKILFRNLVRYIVMAILIGNINLCIA